MDEKDKIIANARSSAMVMGMTAMGLQDFVASIIKQAREGVALTDEVLAEMIEKCIVNLKNSEMTGTSIQQEAETFRGAIDVFTQFAKSAVTAARQV